jgi:hypothetical protein
VAKIDPHVSVLTIEILVAFCGTASGLPQFFWSRICLQPPDCADPTKALVCPMEGCPGYLVLRHHGRLMDVLVALFQLRSLIPVCWCGSGGKRLLSSGCV